MSIGEMNDYMQGDSLAVQVGNLYSKWEQARQPKMDEVEELRNFLFATDTRTTSVTANGWSNSTTLPKITQIRDNLFANYIAALFPTENWLQWIGGDYSSTDIDTRLIIQSFMRNRLTTSGFRQTIEDLVLDFIDYGNCFADIDFITESYQDENGESHLRYIGPKLVRIAPTDIVFDITAPNFANATKITRCYKSIGELERDSFTDKRNHYAVEALALIKEKRAGYAALDGRSKRRYAGIKVDGFGDIDNYFASGMVEILELEGSVYDPMTNEYHHEQTITVLDRSHILRKVSRPSMKIHAGWRKRPDNLWAMGPLDNLVGMQYRMDHLENLRADIFDRIAHPVKKVKGDIPEFTGEPDETIYIGDEGDVTYLVPDSTALNADFQIQRLEQLMELYAGAPREAMGVRTAGEKTAFEVQRLETAASRIFQQKVDSFETTLMEPAINNMFELTKQLLPDQPIVEQLIDTDTGLITFEELDPDQLRVQGKFRPIGARHFSSQAKLTQDLNNFLSSPVGQDVGVRVHFSGKEIAKLISDQLGFSQYKLFGENIQVAESHETQLMSQEAQQNQQLAASTPLDG